jgi:hypothetical protein
LPHQTPLSRAKRSAHRKLLLADQAARNQQIGHICASNQQHQCDGHHQPEEYRRNRAGQCFLIRYRSK